MNELDTRLANCFAAVFPDLSPEAIRQASQASVAGWDSINALTLVNVVEEEFGIQIDLEAVAELSSFPLILEYLRGRLHC